MKRALGPGASCCGEPKDCDQPCAQAEITFDPPVVVEVEVEPIVDLDPFDEEEDE